MRSQSVSGTAVLVLVVVSTFALGRAIAIAATTSPTIGGQEARNVGFDLSIQDLTRRLGHVEDVVDKLRPEVAVMQSDMSEVKWIARGAAGLIVAQIMAAVFGVNVKMRKREEQDDNVGV